MNQIEQTITTLEIAEMMETRHDRVLRKLEGQDVRGKHTAGIIEILTHHNLGASVDNVSRVAVHGVLQRASVSCHVVVYALDSFSCFTAAVSKL